MPLLGMLSLGFFLPNIEPHLLSYDVQENDIGFWYMFYTVGYLFGSFLLMIPYRFKKQLVMSIGCISLTVGYFLLGPSPLFFVKDFTLVCVGLFSIGLGIAFMSGNIYIVPAIPHMIDVAKNVYGFEDDYKLNDAITSLANINCSLGEIFGPIIGSYLAIYSGFGIASSMLGFVFLSYTLFYLSTSGIFSIAPNKKHIELEYSALKNR